ncbi:hypothetical protein SAMN04487948_101293 [Halogranum amylolyticum]|uniref:Right handed beta helix region n=1 Tax=Halogranum amylolyticum TaxID=660520 RepID=A0A1H8N454_9EURY|nr:right-handed parallel beta-helix repeat-containing protein [Halogranum amylolyticum]SEO24342.1 hypothetical protein SAMN04487948_101293 [Halogranum amylolyticum]
MVRDRTGHSSLSRRTLLGSVGLTCLSAVAGSSVVAAAESDYGTVVDIEEAGADSGGEDPIDDVFDDVKGDDTLVTFPPGTYKANRLIIYGLTNFAMVGEGDVTLVPGENYDTDLWLAGAETRDVRIENFTFDHRGDDVTPKVDIGVEDGLVVRDVTKVGSHDAGGPSTALDIYGGGSALLERFVATDGGKSVGVYAGGDGSLTVRDCRIERFDDNGLYVSNLGGSVTVDGGTYRNNNVSQIRVGSPNTVVRDADIAVDEPLPVAGDDVRNMRGVRIADGPGPVSIENCDITMKNSEGTGAIVGAYSGGSFTVTDTRIHVGADYTTIGSDGSRTSYAVFVDDATTTDPGTRTFDGVSVTGGGTYRSAMRFRRDGNTIRNCCIEQSGTGRDGIVFESSTDNVVIDSTIDVTDDPVREIEGSSVATDGIATSGSCPLPSNAGGDDGDDGVEPGDEFPGETGSVRTDQANRGEWHSVSLQGGYDDPVAVATPLSSEGPHPCDVRLQNVGSDGFDFQLEEWLYLDGDHWTETAHYLVLDGDVTSLGGLPATVGTVDTNHRFSDVAFEQSFGTTPVVLSQSQTCVGSDPIVTRPANVSAEGFDVRVQEEDGEEHGGYHYVETVGYVAVEPGTGTVDGREFEVGRTPEAVDEDWYTIEFENDYEEPRFLADVQTYNGWNSVVVRYRNLTSDSVEVRLQEEQSEDAETGHDNERLGFVVVESA